MESGGDTTVKILKFLLIGNPYVGKSCFLNRFSDGKVVDEYAATIGVDFASKDCTVDGEALKIQIWDTSGQKRFNTIVSTYFKGAAGVMIMFDITDKKTFEEVPSWLGQVKSQCGDDVKLLLVGNKLDLETERQVELNDVEDFAAKEELDYLEISARDRKDVHGTVMDLTRLARTRDPAIVDNKVKMTGHNRGTPMCCSLS